MTENTNDEELEVIADTGDEPSGDTAGGGRQAAAGDDELDSYSKGVQERIKKLTGKYRNEQRDREEAQRLSQTLMEENKRLKDQVSRLDNGYLSEYGTRLSGQINQVKEIYRQAYDAGDSDTMADAQMALSKLAIEEQRYNSAKARASSRPDIPDGQQPPQPQQRAQQQAPRSPDPKAKSWAEKNKWFGEDRVMTTGAFAIHQELVDSEGFDPQTDEYYTELDKRMRREFPHKFKGQSGGSTRVASAGASASRTQSGRRTVRLTPSQVATATRLGVPLEEYAKYVKE